MARRSSRWCPIRNSTPTRWRSASPPPSPGRRTRRMCLPRPDKNTGANPMTISRRKILQAAAGTAIGSGAITGFPTIWAQNIKNITLRQFGTGVSNLNAIADRCKKDTGITLSMTAMDTDAAAQRAVTQPHSYDIADIEYFTVKKVFPTGVLQPLDVKKIKYYDE